MENFFVSEQKTVQQKLELSSDFQQALKKFSKSKYIDVKASDLKTSAEKALKDLIVTQENLFSIQSNLYNKTIIPNGVGRTAVTALKSIMTPVQGEFSIGALKRHLTILKSVASTIVSLQSKWKDYDKILEKIKKEKEKESDCFSQVYYNRLINQRDQAKLTLFLLEIQVDEQLKNICT